MKRNAQRGILRAGGVLLLAALGCTGASAQAPVVVGTAVDTAVPIIVHAVKPHRNTGLEKFEGTIMNANIVQLTVRSRADELAIRTFTLSQQASARMQQIVEKGGYQYGDKVTVYYQPGTTVAVKFKGKPSKPI